jgi:hypothetical protein
MPNYKPIPSIEEIEEMDKQREKAIESLEISGRGANKKKVKCQRCGNLQPIVKQNDSKRLLPSVNSGRITYLRKRIKWVENHPHYVNSNKSSCEAERQELAELLEEDKKRDILRRIPLYSCKITGYRFVCSKCYDEAYLSEQQKRKEEILNLLTTRRMF